MAWQTEPSRSHERTRAWHLHVYQVVLFDLGGVLVDVEGIAAFQRMLGRSLSQEEVWQRWLTASTWVSTFESGQCTARGICRWRRGRMGSYCDGGGIPRRLQALAQTPFPRRPRHADAAGPALHAGLPEAIPIACIGHTCGHLRAQRPLAPLLSVARDRPPLRAGSRSHSSMSSPTSAVPLPVSSFSTTTNSMSMRRRLWAYRRIVRSVSRRSRPPSIHWDC